MGKEFKYIADDVLAKAGFIDCCSLCGNDGKILPFMSDVDDSRYEVNYVDEVCVSCIKDVKFIFDKKKSVEGRVRTIVKKHYPKGILPKEEREKVIEKISNEYLRTPKLPCFFAHDDWPHCCGDFTEYLGEPVSSSNADLDDYIYWDTKPSSYYESIYDLIPSSKLGVLGGVSAFQCQECSNTYWTYKHT